MTRVSGSGASQLATWDRNGASEAVGPPLYCTIVLQVQAPSSAVRGVPSDQEPGLTLNVHVLPSGDVSQLSAQSPSNSKPGAYCTRTG